MLSQALPLGTGETCLLGTGSLCLLSSPFTRGLGGVGTVLGLHGIDEGVLESRAECERKETGRRDAEMQRGGRHRPTWSWDAEPFVGGWWSCHRLLNPSLMRCAPLPRAQVLGVLGAWGCLAEQPFFSL